jgi:hypothetical protein
LGNNAISPYEDDALAFEVELYTFAQAAIGAYDFFYAIFECF